MDYTSLGDPPTDQWGVRGLLDVRRHPAPEVARRAQCTNNLKHLGLASHNDHSTFSVFALGTGPIRKVDMIKNFKYVISTTPGTEKVEFRWTDDEPALASDLTWYYVRISPGERRARLEKPVLGPQDCLAGAVTVARPARASD
jgi:hypothetical protein